MIVAVNTWARVCDSHLPKTRQASHAHSKRSCSTSSKDEELHARSFLSLHVACRSKRKGGPSDLCSLTCNCQCHLCEHDGPGADSCCWSCIDASSSGNNAARGGNLYSRLCDASPDLHISITVDCDGIRAVPCQHSPC
jgi:hypothetical protein